MLSYKGFSMYSNRIQGWASIIYIIVCEVVFFLSSCLVCLPVGLSYYHQPNPTSELKMESSACCMLGKCWFTEHLLF